MNLKKFLGEVLVMLAFTFSAFWVITTSVTLIPMVAQRVSEDNLLTLIYAIGGLAFSTMIVYYGLKYLKVFGDDKDD